MDEKLVRKLIFLAGFAITFSAWRISGKGRWTDGIALAALHLAAWMSARKLVPGGEDKVLASYL